MITKSVFKSLMIIFAMTTATFAMPMVTESGIQLDKLLENKDEEVCGEKYSGYACDNCPGDMLIKCKETHIKPCYEVHGPDAPVEELGGNAPVEELGGNAPVTKLAGNAPVAELGGKLSGKKKWGVIGFLGGKKKEKS
ncbi:hypothetical protein DFH28DRAFT_926217 [Melampsora americana]|nr:hypothetical protein DFH28DRAFT_926217 [Melampsora americana]